MPAEAVPEAHGRARPVIAAVQPVVDGGRFPAKTAVGEALAVEADVFTDGHDRLQCDVRYRHDDDGGWTLAPMAELGNDRWRGEFPVERPGRYRFCVRATVDRFGTWHQALAAKVAAGQDVAVELLGGAELLRSLARRAPAADRPELTSLAERLEAAAESDTGGADGLALVSDPGLAQVARRHPDLSTAALSGVFAAVADRARARFSAWYELFPRSASPDPARPGTLADVVDRLDYVTGLGFDVLYLPPVHPIGTTNRKGPDGSPQAGDGDPGSPWAIGGPDGGHLAVHRDLGTVDDLVRLADRCRDRGVELALDLAFQCSPDHPWVKEHPDWFRHRPDGTIAYAENPPKRYEDVYPLDFETADWRALWSALEEVVEFWIAHGVTVFRVDNPHTKPLRLWEWLIASVHEEHPEVIFLSEAFTRPRVMEHLAKIGFTQSYTYFTWRNTKWEIETYAQELTRLPLAAYFRPNFWPNTPDILHETLQHGGRGAFMARLVLAATLAANYGIYGPAFELQEHEPRQAGSEEYRHSEKYEVRHWDLDAPHSLADFVSRVNAVRRAHRALQHDRSLHFHAVENDWMVAYSKTAPADAARGLGASGPIGDRILVVVCLDPHQRQTAWVHLDLDALGLDPDRPYEVHDLLTDARYQWTGPHNFVALDPDVVPAHLFEVRPAPASAA